MKQCSLAFTIVLLAALVSACGGGSTGGQTDAPGTVKTSGSPNVQNQEPSNGEEAEPMTELTVTYYVSDAELSELKEKQLDVAVAAEADKYMAALEALQLEEESAGDFSLWKGIEFHSAVLENGGLTVDLTIPDEARLGAPGEAMALEALQNTVFQFEEVTSLEILVDGNEVESLMGHVVLEHPIERP